MKMMSSIYMNQIFRVAMQQFYQDQDYLNLSLVELDVLFYTARLLTRG